MGEVETYFFDTYAFYELIHGNPNYAKYSSNIVIVTTKLNLMELHYGLMLIHGKHKADAYYDEFAKFSVDFNDKTIKLANEFKMYNKSKKLSYVDCIGYITAKSMNILFLTGDKGFENIDNVEYVK